MFGQRARLASSLAMGAMHNVRLGSPHRRKSATGRNPLIWILGGGAIQLKPLSLHEALPLVP